ncbi:MAG: response regulator [Nitrospiraceae bacterium]
MARILVIDDEPSILDLLRTILVRRGHEVVTASSGQRGLARFREDRPRLTILDLKLPDMGGVQVLKDIRAFDPEAAVVILTGAGTDELEAQAKRLGAVDFLQKGFSLHALGEVLNRVLKE